MKKVFWIVVAMLFVSIALNVWQCSRQPEESTVIKHDTVWKDSIIREPVATETKETGETIYVKVPAGGDTLGTADHGDRLLDSLYPHQCWNQEPVPRDRPDSIEIALPVDQKRYDDSLYTAWVSGFRPNLDSILIHQREITTTVTKTIVKSAPRLSVGIQAGAGYGIINRQPDIYIGIGAQWRIWPK